MFRRLSVRVVLALFGLFFCWGANVAQAQVRVGYCTEYVAAVRGLAGYPHAYKWANGYLASKGFRQVDNPTAGAIAVFQPGVESADPTYGHVGIVYAAFSTDSTGRVAFGLKGANQGPSNVIPFSRYFSEAGFSNVSVRKCSTIPGKTAISFWVR